jgi:RNA polymerase sigma factor for flagellar operon FliA
LEQNYEAAFGQTSPAETPEGHYDRRELREILTQTIEKLSEKEKMVVTLYYFEELTLKEISGIMGVSESRVSQIHSKALLRLQGKLGKYKGVLFA